MSFIVIVALIAGPIEISALKIVFCGKGKTHE